MFFCLCFINLICNFYKRLQNDCRMNRWLKMWGYFLADRIKIIHSRMGLCIVSLGQMWHFLQLARVLRRITRNEMLSRKDAYWSSLLWAPLMPGKSIIDRTRGKKQQTSSLSSKQRKLNHPRTTQFISLSLVKDERLQKLRDVISSRDS